MKITGIIQRIDDLGRIVIPKEIRMTLRIHCGDPIELFVDAMGHIVLKKYSPVGELGNFAKEYADSLYEVTGHIAAICDRNQIVAVAGTAKQEFLGQPVAKLVEQVMEHRSSCLFADADIINSGVGRPMSCGVISPIVLDGDFIGAVIICSRESGVKMTETEIKLVEVAGGFLAKQMEG